MSTPAWPEIRECADQAPYPVEVLPVDAQRAQQCLSAFGMTERSWLGAVMLHTGAILIDHGWLRVLGSGYEGRRGPLPDVVSAAAPSTGSVTVAHDVLGGHFVWRQSAPESPPTVHYYAPDTLAWEDLELGYGRWLAAMLTGWLSDFYASLRWSGWADEVAGTRLDQGIHTWPPPWTAEGKDLGTVSRRAISMTELISFHQS
ncbi:DUF2625 domain-containing protein [Kineosporia rhizophila]|uniref:DUF2625 family protein n=1 Tax=Kineosporia rhizophila TaxID=84633 RepID=UPI001E5983EF|nr:DUF2625 family protein [Kineosporia rhizophila]MCE0537686.1 DUF2625 domain-containing protein [Kineosporia rhizophila]